MAPSLQNDTSRTMIDHTIDHDGGQRPTNAHELNPSSSLPMPFLDVSTPHSTGQPTNTLEWTDPPGLVEAGESDSDTPLADLTRRRKSRSAPQGQGAAAHVAVTPPDTTLPARISSINEAPGPIAMARCKLSDALHQAPRYVYFSLNGSKSQFLKKIGFAYNFAMRSLAIRHIVTDCVREIVIRPSRADQVDEGDEWRILVADMQALSAEREVDMAVEVHYGRICRAKRHDPSPSAVGAVVGANLNVHDTPRRAPSLQVENRPMFGGGSMPSPSMQHQTQQMMSPQRHLSTSHLGMVGAFSNPQASATTSSQYAARDDRPMFGGGGMLPMQHQIQQMMPPQRHLSMSHLGMFDASSNPEASATTSSQYAASNNRADSFAGSGPAPQSLSSRHNTGYVQEMQASPSCSINPSAPLTPAMPYKNTLGGLPIAFWDESAGWSTKRPRVEGNDPTIETSE